MECWGRAAAGQLGLGDTPAATQDKPYPSMVPLFDGANPRVQIIAAGGAHTCVKAVASGVDPLLRRQRRRPARRRADAADGYVDATLGATPVTARSVTAGAAHTCALDADGRVWCWGRGDEGQLGDGARSDRPAPTSLALGDGVTRDGGRRGRRPHLRAAPAATCCAGGGAEGQMASVDTTDVAGPAPVAGLEGAIAIVAGGAHSCAVAADGGALCWGANDAVSWATATVDAHAGRGRGLSDVERDGRGRRPHLRPAPRRQRCPAGAPTRPASSVTASMLTAGTPQLARIACQ